MTISAPVRAAFAALIDYAGLFPPAALPMDGARAEYAEAKRGEHAWMLGRFIVPASRIAELGDFGKENGLCAIANVSALAVDPAEDTTRWFNAVTEILNGVAQRRSEGARVEALEVLIPRPRWQRETYDASIGQLGALLVRSGLNDLKTYAEIPKALGDPAWFARLPGAMSAAVRAGIGVKLRCGGPMIADFPAEEEVAAFIAEAATAGAPFKATAGLHHPVRHYEAETGLERHGFVNLLAAAAFAADVDLENLTSIVAEQDSAVFAFDDASLIWRAKRASVEELERMRAKAFVGYGSCSFSEPVEDLTALGLLGAPV
jgi:hypothetical protein